MKAPARVRDVQSAWGPPAATPPSPAATPPPVAAQTQPAVPPQPVPAAGAEEVATTMRPAVVAAQPAAPTEARPRRVEAPQPTPAAPRAGRRRTSLLVGGVTITAAAAVLIAILLSGGNGDDPPPTAGPTSQSHSAGEVFSQQLPDPQHLTGRVAAHEVTFSWAPVAGAELYIWATPRGSFKTVAQTHVSVPRSPDGQTCITVWTRVTGGSRTGGTSKCVG